MTSCNIKTNQSQGVCKKGEGNDDDDIEDIEIFKEVYSSVLKEECMCIACEPPPVFPHIAA